MSKPPITSPTTRATDLIFIFDEQWTLQEWNRTAVEVTGYTQAELAGKESDELFEGRDVVQLASLVDEGGSAESTVDLELVTARERKIAYEVKPNRVSGGGNGTDIVLVCRAVSESKRIARERRSILDRMDDAFFAVDEEWKLTYVNEQAVPILTAAMGEQSGSTSLEGNCLRDEIPAAVGTIFDEQYHEAMHTQEAIEFEEYYPPLDTWFDVSVYPTEEGLSVHFRDVTEQRSQREALVNRERALRDVYDVISAREMAFDEQISALLTIGRNVLGATYGTLSEIRDDEYVFQVVDADDDSIQTGDVVPLSATNCETVATTEETLVLGDVARDAPDQTGRDGYSEWGISCYLGAPVFVDDGVYGTFCFYDTEPRADQFSDWHVTLVDLMSRWVSYELQHRHTAEQLRLQNERLEQFASILSHDLRNPLSVAKGRLELRQAEDDGGHLEIVERSLDRMEALIDDALRLANAEPEMSECETIELESFAERCWEGVVTEGMSLAVDTDASVRADRTHLQQLLENLFRNSAEHGGTNATVTVGTSDEGFHVEDDGPGIPPGQRDAVFETGHSTGKDGTGLGLSIATQIVEAHGWRIDVTEGASGGAKFEITGVEFADEPR